MAGMREVIGWFHGLQPEAQAAWAQAVLSVLAIGASVLLFALQHWRDRKRDRRAEAERKRLHLESAFQLVAAVAQVVEKVTVHTADPLPTRQSLSGRDVLMMKLELDGLVDVLSGFDYSSREHYVVIEAMLVALSTARALVADLTNAYPGTNAHIWGERATELHGQAAGLLDDVKARAGVLKLLADEAAKAVGRP